jgi:hypothetical protein
MYYVDDILMLESGLRIASKALLPIGIAEGSLCWGLEVMAAPRIYNETRPVEDKEEQLPHLLVSAFYPTNWHILFRVVIEMRNRIGVLAETAEILKAQDFNILSTQCGPAGHNHATWHIIGEALSLKDEVDKALKQVIKAHFQPDRSAFDSSNNEFRRVLTSNVSEKMLRYSIDLENAIRAADEVPEAEGDNKHKFLHARFADLNTLIYIGTSLSDDITEQSKELLTQPVTCNWLQNLAVFRIYSEARQKPAQNKDGGQIAQGQVKYRKRSNATYNEPISFRYDSATALLRPAGVDDLRIYKELIEKYGGGREQLPIRAIGGFNHQEHYVRIVVPEQAKRSRQVSIRVAYSLNFDGENDKAQASSIGLLRDVTKEVKDSDTNLNYISNTMTEFSKNREEGIISLMGISEKSKITKTYLDLLKSKLNEIDAPNDGLKVGPIEISAVGAKRMFVSTKFDWLRAVRPVLRGEIANAAKRHGFDPVWGDPQLTSDSQNKSESRGLAENVTDRICTSQVFLQIIPAQTREESRADKKNERDMEWLNYELGVACGARLPCAVCIDKNDQERVPRFAYGWANFIFDSDQETPDIIKELEQAFIHLEDKAYGKT